MDIRDKIRRVIERLDVKLEALKKMEKDAIKARKGRNVGITSLLFTYTIEGIWDTRATLVEHLDESEFDEAHAYIMEPLLNFLMDKAN